jgi:sec-independent protein translocase protein TatA
MIPGLPQVGATELIILLTIILLFFGAKRIPELARSLGRGKREFHRGASEDADALADQGKLPEDEEKSAQSEGGDREPSSGPPLRAPASA